MHETFEELSKREKENIQKTEQLHGKEMRFYIECFDVLNETVTQIAESVTSNNVTISLKNLAVIAMCNRILGTSKVFLDLLMKSYYYDANILYRSLMENTYLMEYLIENEKNIKEWINGELKFSKVKKELGLFSSKAFSKAYDGFSDYVHSNIRAVLSLTSIAYGKTDKTNAHGEKYPITIFAEPTFRKEVDLKDAFSPTLIIHALDILSRNYAHALDSKTKSQIKKVMKKWLKSK